MSAFASSSSGSAQSYSLLSPAPDRQTNRQAPPHVLSLLPKPFDRHTCERLCQQRHLCDSEKQQLHQKFAQVDSGCA